MDKILQIKAEQIMKAPYKPKGVGESLVDMALVQLAQIDQLTTQLQQEREARAELEGREEKARAILAGIPQTEWIALWGMSPSIARPLERAVEAAFAALARPAQDAELPGS